MLFGHGDDTYLYGDKVKMNFSANYFMHTDLTELKEFLATRLDVIGHFPEPVSHELEQMIAQQEGISPNHVMVTAGSVEAVYLIAQLYHGWASVIAQPTFNEYEDACKLHRHIISYYDNDELEILPKKRVYWLCNPNNPTGNVLLKVLVNRIVRQQQQYIFVIDQSAEDYSRKAILHSSEMSDCHNVIMLHSMSMKYGVPGLRLGYITASPIIIERLRLLKQPWTINALAVEAGKWLVQNHFSPVPDMEAYLAEAQRLHEELSKLEGVMVMDSDTNYMLLNIDGVNSRTLKTWLVDNYGILIRDASNFHGLDDHCIRVSAQTPEEDDTLVTALADYLEKEKQAR